MITLLHGDDEVSSRKNLTQLIEKYEKDGFEIVSLEGKTITPIKFEDALRSDSLFETKRVLVLENYFSNNKKQLLQIPDSSELIFYEDEKLSSLPKIPDLKVQLFEFPQIVFKFLDSLSPSNQKNFMPLFEQYRKSNASEIIHTMIVRQFRLMLLSLAKSVDNPSDFKSIQPWMLTKYNVQAKKFGEEVLKIHYQKLLDMDYRIKTGKTNFDLGTELELWLLTI